MCSRDTHPELKGIIGNTSASILRILKNDNIVLMKKIYYLSTCNTCMRILKELEPLSGVELHNIKSGSYTASQLEEMKALAGSYEDLFSRRAQLFSQRKLKEQELKEANYKKLLLEHYTFLKRPVVIVDDAIFIGNSKKVVAAAREALHP